MHWLLTLTISMCRVASIKLQIWNGRGWISCGRAVKRCTHFSLNIVYFWQVFRLPVLLQTTAPVPRAEFRSKVTRARFVHTPYVLYVCMYIYVSLSTFMSVYLVPSPNQCCVVLCWIIILLNWLKKENYDRESNIDKAKRHNRRKIIFMHNLSSTKASLKQKILCVWLAYYLLLQLQQLLLFLLQHLQLLLCRDHCMRQWLERHLGRRAQGCRSFTNGSRWQATHCWCHAKSTHWY